MFRPVTVVVLCLVDPFRAKQPASNLEESGPTYHHVDRLSGGGFSELRALLHSSLRGIFGGVHLLPFFNPIDGADAGFDPIDHTQIDSRLAPGRTYVHSARLRVDGGSHRQSHIQQISSISGLLPAWPRFDNWPKCSSAMTTFFRREQPRRISYAYIARARIAVHECPARVGREGRLLWTTFTAHQIDIDVEHPQGRAYLTAILERFRSARIRVIRLDAVGYAIKKRGTSCS